MRILERFSNQDGDIKFGGCLMYGLGGAFLAATAWSSFSIITAREVAVKHRFGQVVDREMDRGFNFKVPFIDGVTRYSTIIQRIDINAEETRLMATGATKIVGSLNVNYRFSSQGDIAKFYEDFRSGESDVEEQVLKPLMVQALVEVVGDTQPADLISESGEFTRALAAKIQSEIDKKNYPIEVVGVQTNGFGPGPEAATQMQRYFAESQRAELLRMRGENARIEGAVVEAEAANVGRAYQGLINSGVPADAATVVYCIKFGENTSRPCVPGTAMGMPAPAAR